MVTDVETIRRVFVALGPALRKRLLGTRLAQWRYFERDYPDVRERLRKLGYNIEHLERIA